MAGIGPGMGDAEGESATGVGVFLVRAWDTGYPRVEACQDGPRHIPGNVFYVTVYVCFNGPFYLCQGVHLKNYSSYIEFYLETNLNKK